MKVSEVFRVLRGMEELTGKRYGLRFMDIIGVYEVHIFDNVRDYRAFIRETYNSADDILNADYNRSGKLEGHFMGMTFTHEFDIVEL